MSSKTILALCVPFLILTFLGVISIINKTKVTTEEVIQYSEKQLGVTATLVDTSIKDDTKEYILFDEENKLQFSVFVEDSTTFPDILGNDYSTSFKEASYSNRFFLYLDGETSIEKFTYTEQPIYLALIDDIEVPVFKATYNGNLTMYEFSQEGYDDLYSLIVVLNNLDIDNLYIDIEGSEGGRITLGNLTSFKSSDSVKSRIADLFITELDKQNRLEQKIKSLVK